MTFADRLFIPETSGLEINQILTKYENEELYPWHTGRSDFLVRVVLVRVWGVHNGDTCANRKRRKDDAYLSRKPTNVFLAHPTLLGIFGFFLASASGTRDTEALFLICGKPWK
jgi:hypothetical protein